MSLLSSIKAMFAAKPAHAHDDACCQHEGSAAKPEAKACCQAEGACDDKACEKDCDCEHAKTE
ncbi:MAG: hypothetical protein AAB776_04230 [Patescibacteria group bacterium]